jgi:predicted nucleotide-binding protein
MRISTKEKEAVARREEHKFSVFIGSSAKALPVAKAVQAELSDDFACEVWTQGTFAPTQNTLQALIGATRRFDLGVFIFCCDDIRLAGRERQHIPRDNVLFECGLFFGSLGQGGSFLFVPQGGPPVWLPSDLAGITKLLYRDPGVGGNIRAAVGPACEQLRRCLLVDLRSDEAKILNGQWVQSWKIGDPHAKDAGFTPASVLIAGKRFTARCEDEGGPYRLVGEITNRVITGEWESLSRAVHYYGAFQLVIKPRANEMRGKWVGFHSNNVVGSGSWIWKRTTS